MNSLTKALRPYTFQGVTIQVADLFVDGFSISQHLKERYPDAFASGRFKELMIPVLFGGFDDKEKEAAYIKAYMPHGTTNTITPLYHCHDGCCLYIYVEIERKNDCIVWKRIGRNALYTIKKANEIDWLPDFEGFSFPLPAYTSFIASLEK